MCVDESSATWKSAVESDRSGDGGSFRVIGNANAAGRRRRRGPLGVPGPPLLSRATKGPGTETKARESEPSPPTQDYGFPSAFGNPEGTVEALGAAQSVNMRRATSEHHAWRSPSSARQCSLARSRASAVA